MTDRASIASRIFHIAQRAFGLLKNIRTNQPVIRPFHKILGCLAGHIGKGLVDPAGLAGVTQTRILFGKAMADFMGGHIQADQWIKG